ncbi:MAG TPA: fumarylacetoacetate hydrolase family protein [Gaiellales bacterium]|nr:fumarylacetoacetate hydrolase family protein [Gaiellales bacterium]
MKAVRYAGADGAPRLGRLEDDHIVDAGPAPAVGFDASPAAWEGIASAAGEQVAVAASRLLHPCEPRKLIGIGLNYRDHAAESELDIPSVPVLFAKWPSALVGHGATIVVPREETRPDYEGEVAVVIGRRTYRADAEAARAAVGGISAMNDVSGRRAQLETPLRQFTLGKSFDTFAPMGPSVTSADGVDLAAIDIKTTVSGEELQSSNTRNLIFSIVELIQYASAGMTLEPGDVIATGTPGGVGDSRTPPRYLRDGDVVDVWVDGVGTLRNPVALET